MIPSLRARGMRFLIAFTAALTLAAAVADARPGRSGAFGSRGARTFQAPPPTPTAPRQAAPLERSTAQPGPSVTQGMQRPAVGAPRGGFFSTRGGFLGGLFGAGLLGMLLGYGLFGGLGGLGSILGLLLQIVLIVFLARLAFRFFQRRYQPAHATAGGAPLHRDAAAAPRPGGLGGCAAPRANVPRDEIGIGQSDLDGFERLLQDIQAAYGREDTAALQALATPEMAGYFEQELAENRRRGLLNHVSDVKLLQGDLAESWREGGLDYATVAMRFALKDYATERATGRIVEGSPDRPTEAVEVWTFVRPRGGAWRLSAIQQT
jgi:predicted lipid-binding transport protein (Tim44 family)